MSVHYSIAPQSGWGKSIASGADLGGTTGLTGGTLAFTTTTTTKTITIVVYGDTTTESDDPITITLDTPSAGATIIKATGTLTILNDD